jgi:hypothetical protein
MIADTHKGILSSSYSKKEEESRHCTGDQKYCAFRLADLVVLGTICAILADKTNSGTMFFSFCSNYKQKTKFY